MLAISTLSAGWLTFFYAVALALFVLGAFPVETRGARLMFTSLGLAFFTFPLFWNSLAAT
jgi:hypothetical protein